MSFIYDRDFYFSFAERRHDDVRQVTGTWMFAVILPREGLCFERFTC